MGRKYVQQDFGPADASVTIRTWEGGVKAKVSVFGRLTGTGGAASIRVYGSFTGFEAVDAGGGAGGVSSSAEVQTLDFGGIITGDFWLGSLDISELGNTQNPEFVGANYGDQNTRNQATRYATVKTEDVHPGNPADATTGLPPAPIDSNEFYTTQRAGAATASAQITQNTESNSSYQGYIPEQDFTLTFNGHTTSVIVASSDMTVALQAAIDALVDFDPGDVTVSRTSATVYSLTFGGAYEGQDVGAFTITNVIGFTATGVTEATKGGTDTSGGSGLEEITDTAALANGISQIVGSQENKYPYLTLVFGGDADPGLTAEAYIVTY